VQIFIKPTTQSYGASLAVHAGSPTTRYK